jgi:hypothetical protein
MERIPPEPVAAKPHDARTGADSAGAAGRAPAPHLGESNDAAGDERPETAAASDRDGAGAVASTPADSRCARAPSRMGHVSFDLAFSSGPRSRLFADELHAALDFAVAKHR